MEIYHWVVLNLYIFYCIRITCFPSILKQVQFQKKQQQAEPEAIKKKFYMIRRTDPFQWRTWSMLLTAWLIVPLRIALILSTTGVGLVFGFGLVRFFPKGTLRHYGYRSVCYVVGRMFVFCSGHMWIKEEQLRIEDYLPGYQGKEVPEKEACIVVANHISQCDIFYLIQRLGVSFVGKADAKKLAPLKWAGECCDAIWVDRTKSEERHNAAQLIKEYVARHAVSPGHPLAIFPEGTTSNGQSIMTLRLGAFLPLSPVKVILFDYLTNNWFHNILDFQGDISTILLSMCCPYLSLKVYSFPPFDPSYLFTPDTPPQDKARLYAQAVQSLMSNCLQLPISDAGYPEVRLYQRLFCSLFKMSLEEAQALEAAKSK